MFPPSLPGIARAFEVDYAIVNLAVAGYAWVACGGAARHGAIVGSLRATVRSSSRLASYIRVASVGCATATGIWSFLAFRLLQAVIISGYSVSLAVIRDSWDEREAASVIGYVSVGWAFAPMLGPVFGGLLDGCSAGARASGLLAVFGVAVLALARLGLSETNTTRSATI